MRYTTINTILNEAGFSCRKEAFAEYWSIGDINFCIKTKKDGSIILINIADGDWGYIKYVKNIRCSQVSVFITWKTGEEWYLRY